LARKGRIVACWIIIIIIIIIITTTIMNIITVVDKGAVGLINEATAIIARVIDGVVL